MKFTRFCVRAIIIVGFALFLIGCIAGTIGLIKGSRSSVTNGFQLITQAGTMLGVGLIAQALLKRD